MQETNYFIMLIDPPWAGPTAELISGSEIETNNGLPLGPQAQPFRIRLVVDPKAPEATLFPPCDIHGPTRRMLLSERALTIFRQAGVDNLEVFKAVVTWQDDPQPLPYQVVNIVGAVNGLDRDRSEVQMGKRDRVIGIERMVLDESRLRSHLLVRLQEHILLMVAHRRVKDAVEAAGLSGFRFVRDDQWRPGMV